MAIALFFRRIAGSDATDQDHRVTYEFGPDPSHTPDRVVIDLLADTIRAADGPDPDASRVAGKVVRLHRETGRWPAEGGYFS